MPTIKNHFRLSVLNGLFYVGHWDHYPSEKEIIETLEERFKGGHLMLNGERTTFKIEKIQFLDSDDITVGDFVEVVESFFLYGQYYEVGERFELQHQHIKYGVEKFVVKFKK